MCIVYWSFVRTIKELDIRRRIGWQIDDVIFYHKIQNY